MLTGNVRVNRTDILIADVFAIRFYRLPLNEIHEDNA